MPRRKKLVPDDEIRRPIPAQTPEGREGQLISEAMNLAEQQMLDGSASSQVITHFLKLGSTRNALETAKLEHETALLETKKRSIESSQRVEELYSQAIQAFKSYQPGGDQNDQNLR